MASDLSKYMGNLICGWITGQDMPAAPTTVYVAIFNGDPKASGTEVTTDIRSAGRVAVDWDSLAIDANDCSITNDAVVDFGNSESDTTGTHAARFDDDAAGNMICSHGLTGGTKTIASGSAVSFPVGNLVFNAGS